MMQRGCYRNERMRGRIRDRGRQKTHQITQGETRQMCKQPATH